MMPVDRGKHCKQTCKREENKRKFNKLQQTRKFNDINNKRKKKIRTVKFRMKAKKQQETFIAEQKEKK